MLLAHLSRFLPRGKPTRFSRASDYSAYTRHNYEFTVWNTLPDGTGKNYKPGESIGNLTDEPDRKIYLYAQWEFYIQMPETGQSGASLILLIGGLAMTASIVIGMRSQIRHERTSNSGSL